MLRGRLKPVLGWAALAAAMALSTAAPPAGAAGVTTAGYSNLRDNWDPAEPALGPAAVQGSTFGKIFSTTVAGAVYAQPLAYNGDIIATTEKANAYAINASTGAVVWKRNFGTPFKSKSIGCSDLTPYIGSTSTPVIDPETGTIYLTTRLEGKGGLSDSHWYLQALSAATGEERAGFPAQITGTPSNTPGVPFNDNYQQQRPGLLLLNGVVYIAFASDCDIPPYRGIVVGMKETNGEMTSMWSDESGVGTGEDSEAGIWQSGGGLVSDIPGRIILTTGNGVSPSPAPSGSPPPTLSESVVGLTVGSGGTLTPSQFFAPSNAPTLDQDDEDLGSGGPIALPTEYFGTKAVPHLVVQVGKDGRIFLINADNMGGYRQGKGETDAVLQTVGPYGGVWGHPAAYGGQGGWIYVLESGSGYLRALSYGLNGSGLPSLTSQATSSEGFGYTSGSPIVTSNGTEAGSAIVWVVYSNGSGGKEAQLRAYSAAPSGGNLPLLWSGSIGVASKFATPTAYEGRVYVGTRNGHLIAFGPSSKAAVVAPAVELGPVTVGAESISTLTLSATRAVTFTGRITASGSRAASALEPRPAPSSDARDGARVPRTAGPAVPPAPETVRLAPGVITVQQPPAGEALAAGQALRLRVRFRPDHAGPVVGVVDIPTSDGLHIVTISGYGTRRGLLVSSQPLSFGKVATGAGGKYLGMTFSNSWTRPERIQGYRVPSGPYTVMGLPPIGTVLGPRQAITLSIHFDPARAGTFDSRLEILTDDGAVTVPATATAITGRARLAVSRPEIDFGPVPVGRSRTELFAVTDAGTIPLTISRVIAPSGEFESTVPLPGGITIDKGAIATVSVTFRPTVAGPATGEYRINSNDGRGYVTVSFTGRGT